MGASAEESTPLCLVLQRLMDADLLLPNEGRALLAEVEAFEQAQGDAQGKTEPETASERGEPTIAMLEALLRADRLDASIAGQAQAIVRQILDSASDPA
jgi:hypothetical protein